MMRSVFSILTGALAALCLASMGCSPDNPAAPEVVTNADAIRISALGNNFSAGFINGGLIQAGQIASFPNLISIQAGGGSLQMPLVNSPGIGSTPGHGALYV
ncbi:MAG: hypothetical protein KJ927_12430, partial [Candidatus Eisenbacteria bacterium]|nr:hypothetical protein [Candidatus Eisenbacteria bacterium]